MSTSVPVGAPCWVDLVSSDPDRSRAFYGALFGWTADDPLEEFGGYVNLRKDGRALAGLMGAMPGAEVTDAWSVHLSTDDADATVAAAGASGGTVVVPPMAVGDLGVMAVLTDPAGAGVGAWQAGTFPGFEWREEPGTPAWFELHTRSYDTAVAFYRDVFRWDTRALSDTPEFRYTVLQVSGAQWAGIMDASVLPDGSPEGWSVYFGVEDADAVLARAVELGGEVVQAAEDTPYGRLAAARDPNGAVFKLVAPNAAMPAGSSGRTSA